MSRPRRRASTRLNQQIAQQKLVVEQDRQQVASDQAALVYSQQNFQRYTELAKDGCGTVQRAQQAQADIREKDAALQHDTAVVAAAEKQIGVLEAQLAQANATLAQQQATRAPGRTQPELHDDHRAGRRHGRRPHPAGRRNMSRPARS